jgi:hypothetical protein
LHRENRRDHHFANGSADGAPDQGTITLQKPLLLPHFPEIASCHNGTINLLLDCPLEIRLPDIVTPPIRWRPNEPEFEEGFGLKRIAFLLDDARYVAWIYIAEHSPHLFKTGVVELVAEHIPGVSYGRRCSIILDRAARAKLFTG